MLGALVATLCVGAAAAAGELDLKLVDGTSCLDGSPTGYYIDALPPNSTAPPTWVFYFQGGGWCFDPELCYERLTNEPILASSGAWAKTRDVGAMSLFSSDQKANPALWDARRVYLPYCDGASWAGGRPLGADPVVVNGTSLHMGHGLANLRLVLDALIKDEGLGLATSAYLTGGSAGGLAVMLHASYVDGRLPTASVRVVPFSGWFPYTTVPVGGETYAKRVQLLTTPSTHNATPPAACVNAFPPDQAWRCLLAEHLVPTVAQPIFVVNSMYDAWTWSNDYGLPCPRGDNGTHPWCATDAGWVTTNCECHAWDAAAVGSVSNKTAAALNSRAKAFSRAVSDAIDSTKDGAFLTSCMGHERELNNSVAVEGVTAAHAIADWVAGRGSGLTVDCTWGAAAPYNCNPACM